MFGENSVHNLCCVMVQLAVNQAILEAEENDDEVPISSEKEPAPGRTRNRPKREVEPSST